jgi:plasmid maintenance system antidote protein VapI
MGKPRQTDPDVGLLREAMDRLGTNPNQLAKQLGRDSSYVYNLLNGKKKSIAAGDALKLERLLHLSAGSLFGLAQQTEERSGAAEKTGVYVDFSASVARRLDREALRLGVKREDLIKVWVDEKMRSVDRSDHVADPRRSIKTDRMPSDLRELALEALDKPYEP